MVDMLKALQSRQGMPEEEDLPEGEDDDDGSEDDMIDPRAMSDDGKTLFIEKEMFPDGCKVGDDVIITATVTKHGQKYGVVVNDISSTKEAGKAETADYQ